MIKTTKSYNAQPTEGAAAGKDDAMQPDKEDVLGDDEHVLGVYECTQALEQQICGILEPSMARCLTSRTESTAILKVTTKRIQITTEEATGCCPSEDPTYPRVGHSICCLCCCAPSGLSQSKALAVSDLVGYAVEVTVPRIQILSAFRAALTFWVLLILFTYGLTIATDPASIQLAQEELEPASDAFSQTTVGLESPEHLNPWEKFLDGGVVIVLFTMFGYTLVERAITWGWKFVFTLLFIVGGVALYFFLAIEFLFATYAPDQFLQSFLPLRDLKEILLASGYTSLTLPVFLVIGYFYI